jgi:hypothetical protein
MNDKDIYTGTKTSPEYVRNEKGEIVTSKSVEEELKKKYPKTKKTSVIRGTAYKASAAYTAAYNTAIDAGLSIKDSHIAAEKAKSNVFAAAKLK